MTENIFDKLGAMFRFATVATSLSVINNNKIHQTIHQNVKGETVVSCKTNRLTASKGGSDQYWQIFSLTGLTWESGLWISDSFSSQVNSSCTQQLHSSFSLHIMELGKQIFCKKVSTDAKIQK